MIISFNSLICVQLAKATLILKRKEYNSILYFVDNKTNNKGVCQLILPMSIHY